MKTKTYGKTFCNACKKGTSPSDWVCKAAKRYDCTESYLWNCLKKEGYAFCKKFNGKNYWFPTFECKCPRAKSKVTEYNFWQYAVEFCMQQGWVTPEQVYNWTYQQMYYYCSFKFNKFYCKPKGFSATKKWQTPKSWCTYCAPRKTTKTCKAKKQYTKAKTYKFSQYKKRKAA